MWGKLCNFGDYFKKMLFTGTIQAKLDAKGRVFFPSAFRKQLSESEERLVLKRDVFQHCLVVYPYSVWEQEVAALRSRLSQWNARHAMVLRQFLSDVEVFTLDGNGRFILPKRFMAEAGIDKEVAFIGLDDRIEVWSKASLEEPFMSAADFETALQEIMTSEP